MLHVITHAATHGWQMDVLDLDWEHWHSRLLDASVHDLSSEVRRRIAEWHVRALMPDVKNGGPIGQAFKMLREQDALLYKFTLDNADWNPIRQRLANYRPESLVFGLDELPEPLQSWAIEQAATHPDAKLRDLIRMLTRDARAPSQPLIEKLLVASTEHHEDPGYELPSLLYGVNKERALQAAERAWHKNPESKFTIQWFLSAPASLTARSLLIALIQAMPPSRRPNWIRGYLLSLLHYAGERIDEIFRLSQGVE